MDAGNGCSEIAANSDCGEASGENGCRKLSQKKKCTRPSVPDQTPYRARWLNDVYIYSGTTFECMKTTETQMTSVC